MYNSMFHIQDHTKDFGYIMVYASKHLEMYFESCYMFFNIFQQSWKKFIHSVCLSVRVCACSNCHKYSLNEFLFIHAVHIWYRMDIIEAVRCMGLSVHLQRCTKVFRYISVYLGGSEVFKVYCNIFILHYT